MTGSGKGRQADLTREARAFVRAARDRHVVASHSSTMSGYSCAAVTAAAFLHAGRRLRRSTRA